MPKSIALLRGINVGGNNILPMADLRKILGDLGCTHVKTYIQSGNCVFTGKRPSATEISDAIKAHFDFAPLVHVFDTAILDQILADNPYRQATEDPKSLHIYFLLEPVTNADLEALRSFASETEDFTLTDTAFYLYAPDGIGRSKLAAKVDRHLGVKTTARNLRSASKIAQMAATLP